MAPRTILSNFFESRRSRRPLQWNVNNGWCFHSTPVGNEYVRNILINLDPRKSVGMDNISSHLLRLFALSIAVEVTHLFNYFISTQSIHTEWKSSQNIIYVHKKGSKSEKSDYCPVIPSDFVFKSFWEDYFWSDVCCNSSFAFSKALWFSKGHSCSTALRLKMTESWRAVKTFDSVNHKCTTSCCLN